MKKTLFLIFIFTFIFKSFLSFLISLDSDEVMWSVMANEMSNSRQFFIYFTTQNFRGAIESYIVLPFQYFFGFNLFTLRIASIIFGTLSSVLIYLNLKYILKRTKNPLLRGGTNRRGVLTFFPFLAVLIYNLQLPANLIIHTKTWGSYVFIEFTLLLTFYIFNEYFISTYKFSPSRIARRVYSLSTIGLLVALSFWANMQSLYFSMILILLSLAIPLFQFVLNSFQNLKIYKPFSHPHPFTSSSRIHFINFLTLSTFLITIFNFYLVLKKRMIFNPVITLNNKFGFNFSTELIEQFNISLFVLILIMFSLFLITIVVFNKSLISNFQFPASKFKLFNSLFPFLLLSNLLFIGIIVNVYHNSFDRVSAHGLGLEANFNFLKETILPSFLGQYWPYFLFLLLIPFLFRFLSLLRHPELLSVIVLTKEDVSGSLFRPGDTFLMSLLSFPLMFLLSSIPQLTPTPRYLIVWWPIVSIVLTYSIYLISNIILNPIQNFSQSLIFTYQFLISLVLLFPLLITFYKSIPSYKDLYVERQRQIETNKQYISKIIENNKKFCIGNYWTIGPLMHESNLDVKCWTDPKISSYVNYLHFYEKRFGDKEVYVIE